jgi:acetyl-CoA C-acetyltransferase
MREAFVMTMSAARESGPDGALQCRIGACGALAAIRDRNDLDTRLVDDVILSCVDRSRGGWRPLPLPFRRVQRVVPGMRVSRSPSARRHQSRRGRRACARWWSPRRGIDEPGGHRCGQRRLGADPAVAVPNYFLPQGIAADLIATKYGFSRDDVDAYAVESQKRAAVAWSDGRFANSVIPICDLNGLPILARDEHMRPETSMQGLAALQPSFAVFGTMAGFDAVAIQAHPEIEEVNHVHHAGNSSGIVDGSAAVLVGTREAGDKAGLKPRARIRAFANIGSDPSLMLTGPVDVTQKLFERAGMSFADIDLVEINEAFASVVLRYIQAFDLDPAAVNVNGGAIAMGHPLGATGAMIFGTVLDELERRDLATAIVTLCIGAGMGTATVVERV